MGLPRRFLGPQQSAPQVPLIHPPPRPSTPGLHSESPDHQPLRLQRPGTSAAPARQPRPDRRRLCPVCVRACACVCVHTLHLCPSLRPLPPGSPLRVRRACDCRSTHHSPARTPPLVSTRTQAREGAGLRVPPARLLELGPGDRLWVRPAGAPPLSGLRTRPSIFQGECPGAGRPVPSRHQRAGVCPSSSPPRRAPGWAGLPSLTPRLPPGPSTVPWPVLGVLGLCVAWHVTCHLVTCSPGR